MPASGIEKEAWDNINDPFVINPHFKTMFKDLPVAGHTPIAPWSDSYWPSYQGGIAYRWNFPAAEADRVPFHRLPIPESQVKAMSEAELAVLSPAEKYDIYMGNFSYPTLRLELQRTSSKAESWEGICHGWSAATTNFPQEPGSVVLAGPSGVRVPFGSSDIKALLSYYQGEIAEASSTILGSRCEGGFLWHVGNHFLSSSCRDVNAGAFHVVLANMIGLEGKSFVADMTTGKEVWNFPIHSFDAKIISVKDRASWWAATGTVKEIEFMTKVSYSVETEATWDKIGDMKEEKSYHYRIELNAKGEVIGGEWLQFERPDFLWTQERPKFEGYYGDIEKIYDSSIHTTN